MLIGKLSAVSISWLCNIFSHHGNSDHSFVFCWPMLTSVSTEFLPIRSKCTTSAPARNSFDWHTDSNLFAHQINCSILFRVLVCHNIIRILYHALVMCLLCFFLAAFFFVKYCIKLELQNKQLIKKRGANT